MYRLFKQTSVRFQQDDKNNCHQLARSCRLIFQPQNLFSYNTSHPALDHFKVINFNSLMSVRTSNTLGSLLRRAFPCLYRSKPSSSRSASVFGNKQHQQKRVMASSALNTEQPNHPTAFPGLINNPWHPDALKQAYPTLQEDLTCQVAIIGGGIAGISAAYNLAKAGKDVVLCEARVIGAGQTGRTTAHIMTWDDDWYSYVESLHGAHMTKVVADSLYVLLFCFDSF